MTDRDLKHLHPDMLPLVEMWLRECFKEGLHVIVTETFREPAREDALHAAGITNATSKTCLHCFMIDGIPASKALDFLCLDTLGNVIHNGEAIEYSKAGQIAKNLGLYWGGDFTHPDYDHIEIRKG